MNTQEITEMARQAGLGLQYEGRGQILPVPATIEKLKAFAKLVAAAERERIFSELHEMHLKAKDRHNYYLHAVIHIRAKDEARGGEA